MVKPVVTCVGSADVKEIAEDRLSPRDRRAHKDDPADTVKHPSPDPRQHIN